MTKFADTFSEKEFAQQPAAQIPWSTLIEIIYKSKSHEEMLYYINETYRNRWSRSMVLEQFKMKAYERSLIEPITTDAIKLNTDIGQLLFYVDSIDEILKSDEDNNTIGILLTKTANSNLCKVTLKNVSAPIGISKYKFIKDLPEYLEKKLEKIE